MKRQPVLDIVTLAQAKAQDLKYYYTGKPCPKGHFSKRWVYNSVCLQCSREKDAANPRTKALALKRGEKYRLAHLGKFALKAKRERERNKVKIKARNIARRAAYMGKLKRQPCLECGAVKTEAHHPDYTKPLDVVWLCKKHHQEIHKLCK